MIKVIIALSILLFALTAHAAPFLVCNPYAPEQQVTKFTGILDNQPFSIPYALHSTGAAIIFDIGTLSDGVHTFQEIRAENVRGQSDPVPFVVPGKAEPPSQLRIVK